MIKELERLHKFNFRKCPKLDNSYFYLGYKIVFENDKIIGLYDMTDSNENYTDVSDYIPELQGKIKRKLKKIRLKELREKAVFYQQILNQKIKIGETQKYRFKLREITNQILTLN